jgi:hypothetical protein
VCQPVLAQALVIDAMPVQLLDVDNRTFCSDWSNRKRFRVVDHRWLLQRLVLKTQSQIEGTVVHERTPSGISVGCNITEAHFS